MGRLHLKPDFATDFGADFGCERTLKGLWSFEAASFTEQG